MAEERVAVLVEDLEQRLLLSYSIRPINPGLDAALLSKQTEIPEQFRRSFVANFPDSQSERLFAADSNSEGMVVGYSIVYPKWHGYPSAFEWDGKSAKELDRLIVGNGHWTLDSALAIDDSGRILVTGWNDQSNEGPGRFVLTPVQKPESTGRRNHHFAYKVRDLGIFNRDDDAIGFDKRGEMLVSDGYSSFIWSKQNGWHQINGTYAWFVGATAINTRGEVTGSMWMDGGESHLFRYDSSGFHDLGMFLGGTNSGGIDINNRGQIAGYAVDQDGVQHAVVYDHSGIVDLGSGPDAIAEGITNDGKVLARIDKPVPTAFSIVPIGGFEPVAINDTGVMATVQYESGANRFAYQVWMQHGQQLKKLQGVYGNIYSLNINNKGDLVGTEHRRQFQYSGFVSRHGRLDYLESLIPRHAEWDIYRAGAINDRGQIGAVAEDFNGNYHVVLLTPRKAK